MSRTYSRRHYTTNAELKIRYDYILARAGCYFPNGFEQSLYTLVHNFIPSIITIPHPKISTINNADGSSWTYPPPDIGTMNFDGSFWRDNGNLAYCDNVPAVHPSSAFIRGYTPTGGFLNGILSWRFTLVGTGWEFVTYGQNNGKYRLLVDGKYINRDAYTLPGEFGSICMTKLDFTTAGTREIIFETDGVLPLVSYRVSSGGSLTPKPATGDRVLVMGDSYTEPTGASYLGHGWTRTFAQIMGYQDCIPSGSGGSGYVTEGPFSRVPFTSRIGADIVGLLRSDGNNRVIIYGGINDSLTVPLADLQAAVENCIDQLQASGKCKSICIAGLQWPRAVGGSTYVLDDTDALKAAAIAKGVDHIDLVRGQFTRANGTTGGNNFPMCTGLSGNDGAVAGLGSADFVTLGDNTHPNRDIGHDFVGAYMAYMVRQLGY
jgi:hypothetical protein